MPSAHRTPAEARPGCIVFFRHHTFLTYTHGTLSGSVEIVPFIVDAVAPLPLLSFSMKQNLPIQAGANGMPSASKPAARCTKTLCSIWLITFVLSFTLTGCGHRTREGTVTGFGQAVPAGGGMVQSFVTVKLDDSTETRVWLPQNQELWTTMRRGARSGRIRIVAKRDGEFWKFVRILPRD